MNAPETAKAIAVAIGGGMSEATGRPQLNVINRPNVRTPTRIYRTNLTRYARFASPHTSRFSINNYPSTQPIFNLSNAGLLRPRHIEPVKPVDEALLKL